MCISTDSSHCKGRESRLRQDFPRASGFGQTELNEPIAASFQLPLEPRPSILLGKGGGTKCQRIGSGQQETRLVVAAGLWPWRKMEILSEAETTKKFLPAVEGTLLTSKWRLG